MKTNKSDINILIIFMILAIIGLIIYIVVNIRNNKTSSSANSNTWWKWDWIIFLPKDPDTISVGFSPTRDIDGNIDLVESKNNLIYSEMDGPIIGGKNILDYDIEILPEYLTNLGITMDEFSNNKRAIAVSNKVSSQNQVQGNIPYPGKDLTLYVLNKKTGLMNSYNIYRSVTVTPGPGADYTYHADNVILKPVITYTDFKYDIQKCIPDRNIPALITF